MSKLSHSDEPVDKVIMGVEFFVLFLFHFVFN